jgi:hypothetical protein
MSDLVTATFDLQRTVFEQTHDATIDAIEAQTEAFSAASEAVEETGAFAENAASMTRQAWHTYFDAIEANTPADAVDVDRLRAFVDDAVDAASESQEEFQSALVEALEESSQAAEAAAEIYTEMVDSSFDSALQAHEQAEAMWTDAAEEIEIAE